MAERKNKRPSVVELDPEETRFVLEPTQVEVGSGYAIAVTYDEDEKPIVDIKTYGQVNLAQVRREIERTFPDAQIRQLDQARFEAIVKKGKTKRTCKRK